MKRWGGLFLLSFLVASAAWPNDTLTVPYSSRPAIGDVKVAKEPLSRPRRNLLHSVHHFIVELKGFYPDRTFFILARDGEPIYDLWTLMFPDDIREGRVRLINVSSLAVQDKNLKNYLRQEGLTASTVNELHPLLVDSGYEGTIVNTINATLGFDGDHEIRAHLMSSAHEEIPSSRVAGSFYLKSARSKKPQDGDVTAEAGAILVEALEGVSHFTLTAEGFARQGSRWEPMSQASTPKQRDSALRTMGQVKLYFDEHVELDADQAMITHMQTLIRALNDKDSLDPDTVVRLAAELQEHGYGDVWADLRESIGKGTVEAKGARWRELWRALPGGMPGLTDVLEDEGLPRIRQVEAELSRGQEALTPVAQPAGRPVTDGVPAFSVLDSLRHYLASKVPAEEARRNRALAAFKATLEQRGGLEVAGRFEATGEKLGEGIRADVYELGTRNVIKVAYEGEDTAALELEKLVHDFLVANQQRYPIRVLDILAAGPDGTYLVKPKFNKKNLAKKIIKDGKELSRQQLRSLERVYNTARELASTTGIALDIKPDNLLWQDGELVLVDMGPRTFFQPYFFSLEMNTFNDFLASWKLSREAREGRFMDVEDFVREKGWHCEQALLRSYRQMKADRN